MNKELPDVPIYRVVVKLRMTSKVGHLACFLHMLRKLELMSN